MSDPILTKHFWLCSCTTCAISLDCVDLGDIDHQDLHISFTFWKERGTTDSHSLFEDLLCSALDLVKLPFALFNEVFNLIKDGNLKKNLPCTIRWIEYLIKEPKSQGILYRIKEAISIYKTGLPVIDGVFLDRIEARQFAETLVSLAKDTGAIVDLNKTPFQLMVAREKKSWGDLALVCEIPKPKFNYLDVGLTILKLPDSSTVYSRKNVWHNIKKILFHRESIEGEIFLSLEQSIRVGEYILSTLNYLEQSGIDLVPRNPAVSSEES